MLKLFAWLYILYDLIRGFGGLRRSKAGKMPDWYGVCDSCGKKTSLHRFKSGRYCLDCYVKRKVARDMERERQGRSSEQKSETEG